MAIIAGILGKAGKGDQSGLFLSEMMLLKRM